MYCRASGGFLFNVVRKFSIGIDSTMYNIGDIKLELTVSVVRTSMLEAQLTKEEERRF
jgi:hypothetical protein